MSVRIHWASPPAAGLPATGEAFLEWLVDAVGARDGAPTSPPLPLVLVVRRHPEGGGLLIGARRLGGEPPDGARRLPLRVPEGAPFRLVGFKGKRAFLLDPARTLAFELRARLVEAILEDGERYTTGYSVRRLAACLTSAGFFRAHRGLLVNLSRVREIERIGPGRLRLLLDTADGRAYPVSRPAAARLRRLLRL